ncbi:lipopolysaccharide-induced tumor necrosis factor-alpha factor homolog [Coccinella septempunctata]|uniref:lipopolysaccharide-induced tumor necrosis factor-alpha factor homolog n=1 Tax=Coccinella septempunctata TaxID=41139 RepID=UPI001D079CD5|nr:lipopolysaccharide-induced tumor necrosis factor-alpha factor homolog [Coccinella septempunctata]
MRKHDDEEVECAEVGDKGNRKELDEITSMCTSAILDQIRQIPVDEHDTQPSTSGTVSSKENVSADIALVSSVNITPKSISGCEIFKVLKAVSESENEIPSIPSTPPPKYYRTPPTYSAVMRMGPNTREPKKMSDMDSSKIFARVPPPSYAEVEGIWSDLPRQNSSEVVLFGPDPVYMVCPHCSAIVITETYTQRSTATHLTALVLCLFGCWPCCLLPYFMDSCKNTYHHCPVCNYFFGSYHPW